MARFLTVLVLLLGAGSISWAQGPKITVKNTPGKIRMKSVDKGSIYDKAGLKSGDVIREIDGEPVDHNTPPSAIDDAIRRGRPIKIERNGKARILHSKPIEDATELVEQPI